MTHQDYFAKALLNPTLTCPANLKVWNGTNPSTRFSIYRNNVIVSLIDALADSFPITQALVGVDFFRNMARLFAFASPPTNGVLAFYGEHFADFIDSFPPAATVPYLGDVARLEMCWIHAYHAADASSPTPDELQLMFEDLEMASHVRFDFHPSVQLLSSKYAIVSLWAAHQDLVDISDVDPYFPEAAILVRSDLQVNIFHLEPNNVDFILRLMEGESIAAAADFANGNDPKFNLTQAMISLINSQAITAIYHI